MTEQSPTGGQTSDKGETDVAYRVLARKYRPRTFADLVGQSAVVRTLSNAFETGRIAQAYMLTGVRGIGKTTTARLIARALNYSLSDKPTVHMPETGEHCEAILESRHVDVMEMDAASHTGVDNVREIIEQVRYRPIAARYKVYIIDEVHMLSKAAFNALLKTLEEPPGHVKFIFATTEIRKVPVTVLSRCQRFDLRRVEAATLMEHLGRISELEQVKAEEEALRLIARAAEGSVRDGLSLLDQAIAYGQGAVRAADVSAMLGLVDRTRVIDLFEAVMGGRLETALRNMEEHHALGAEPSTVISDLAAFTHMVTRLKVLGESGADAVWSEDERKRGMALAEKLAMPALTRAWQMLLKGLAEVNVAARPLPAAEMVLIRLAHAADLPSPADLARRLSGGGNEPATSTERHAESADKGGPTADSAPMVTAFPSPTREDRSAGIQTSTNGQASEATTSERAQGALAHELPQPQTFDDIIQLAGAMRDLKTKAWLERFVRPVRVSPGKLEIALEEGAPAELPGELSHRLEAWTGQRWLVMLSDEPGETTIAARLRAERDSLFARAEQTPQVRTILERFPQARILEVRRPDDAAPIADGEAPEEQ